MAKKFSKHSVTWQIFMKYFFLKVEAYPYQLGPMPRGKAINLVQGLNCCNVQWGEEHAGAVPLTLSAKAKSTDLNNPKNQDVPWIVEISTNYKQTGRLPPSKEGNGGDWMQDLLWADTSAAEIPLNPTAPMQPAARVVEDTRTEMDKMLEGLYGGAEGPEGGQP